MGHYAYLDSFDPKTRALATKAREGEVKGCTPLFWLAMFDATNIADEPLVDVHHAAKPETVFTIETPYLITDTASAMARLRTRTPALETLCRSAHAKGLRSFTTYAKQLRPSVVLRLADQVMGRADYVDLLRGALTLLDKLDHPGADPEAYLVEPLTSFVSAEWRGSPNAEFLLAGAGWQRTGEDRARNAKNAAAKQWEKAIGDRTPDVLTPYASSHTFEAEELIQHPTLGSGVVLRTLDGGKVEILFRDGARTLIHARPSATR